MAKKSKSLNPADAFRKAQRAKEVKRNKLDRKKAREEAHAKKDTKGLEAEIRQLENLPKLTPSEQNRLKDLEAELFQIQRARESHQGSMVSAQSASSKAASGNVIIDPATGLPSKVAPAALNQVHATEQHQHSTGEGSGSSRSDPKTMNWFDKDGKLLEPEKSFYYDPILNPFGVPPPGMPMRMKAQVADTFSLGPEAPTGLPDLQPQSNSGPALHRPSDAPGEELQTLEAETGEDTIEDKTGTVENTSDNDQGNPSENDEEDDDDDIPLPDGPPPDALSSEEQDDDEDDILLPEGPPPPKAQCAPQHLTNRPLVDLPSSGQRQPQPGLLLHPPVYLPPISLVPGHPPPSMFNGSRMMPFPMGPDGLPLPPPSYNNFHSLPVAPPSAHLPSKPMVSMNPPPHAFASNSIGPSKPPVQASATLTALPQLRDLKREATSFVPSAIRKKRKNLDRRADLAGLGDSNRIQAAPGTGDDMEVNVGDPSSAAFGRPLGTSLLGALKRDGILADKPVIKTGSNLGGGAEKDDYDRFLESLGDVL